MRHDNAVRKPLPSPTLYRGLHLVTPESLAASRATERKTMKSIRRAQSRRGERIGLGIAAISAPAIWIGHALLRHMHVL